MRSAPAALSPRVPRAPPPRLPGAHRRRRPFIIQAFQPTPSPATIPRPTGSLFLLLGFLVLAVHGKLYRKKTVLCVFKKTRCGFCPHHKPSRAINWPSRSLGGRFPRSSDAPIPARGNPPTINTHTHTHKKKAGKEGATNPRISDLRAPSPCRAPMARPHSDTCSHAPTRSPRVRPSDPFLC